MENVYFSFGRAHVISTYLIGSKFSVETNGQTSLLFKEGLVENSKRQRPLADIFGEPKAVQLRRKGERVESDDLRLVADTMLEGITKYMRMWGVDCVNVNSLDPDQAVGAKFSYDANVVTV